MNNIEGLTEIIRQNLIGQDLRCFFFSKKDPNSEETMSLVNHYKYQPEKEIIKIEMDRNHFEIHQQNLLIIPNCKLLIKKDVKKEVITIWIYCRFIEIKNRFIYVRILNSN